MFRLIGNIIKLFLLIVIAGLIFHNWTAKFLLTTGLRLALGTPASVQEVKVDFANTDVLFEGIEIDNPSGFPPGTLARIPKIFIDFEISSLWEGKIHFATIELNFDELHVIRKQDGKINLLEFKALQKSTAARKEEKQVPQKMSAIPLQIDELILSLGRATFMDMSGPTTAQKNFNLHLDHAVYHNIRGVQDIARIVSWETLKRMSVGGLSNILGSLKPDWVQPEGLIEKAFAAIKEKF